uniref:KH-like RNA-binding domain-containing protein n=1 Tax=Peromyscus maniculatus bairdii TaxID=230844 RepID=A0A8C8UFA7_PERMB
AGGVAGSSLEKRGLQPGTAPTPACWLSLPLLGAPPASPRLRVRPWWFPEHELENPLVLYMEAWLAEMIFGPNRSLISEIEWISQALLRVDTVDSGKMAEITIYGRPSVKNRMKNILSNLATWHKEHHVQRGERPLRTQVLAAHTQAHHPPAQP